MQDGADWFLLVQDVERRSKLVHIGQGWGRMVHVGADYRKMVQVGAARYVQDGADWCRIV